MFFRKLSRIYAGGLIGASLFALGVACEQTGDPPPSQSDDLATADIATGPDLTPYNTPVVSSVLPNSGANNVATSITVSGTDFRPGAQVTVGGTACTNVIVTSSTSITCTVPAKTATCGPRDIVVIHPDDGKSATGLGLFTYRSSGTVAFAPLTNYSVAPATGPRRIVAVDVNRV